jgi:hypothetical protein
VIGLRSSASRRRDRCGNHGIEHVLSPGAVDRFLQAGAA